MSTAVAHAPESEEPPADSASRAGRIIGVLIILQMVGSAVVNFGIEVRVFDPPGFLINAASHSNQIGFAALLALAMEATWVGIAITAYPIFHQRTPRLALSCSPAWECHCLAIPWSSRSSRHSA
jgi:hypothetical protein